MPINFKFVIGPKAHMTISKPEDPKPLSTGEALYQAILRNPHEDDVRLRYADYLDGLDVVRVPCPVCDGWDDDTFARNTAAGIHVGCTGSVLDTSAADRAEFIRVQCALEPIRNVVKYGEELHEKVWLELRERDILARHRAEWSKCVCPPSPFGCEGTGWAYGAPHNCKVCGGTGDLLVAPVDRQPGQNLTKPRPVEFRRGFVDSVGCTLGECGAEQETLVWCEECQKTWVRMRNGRMVKTSVCPACNGTNRKSVRRWVPTPWARALVRALPVTHLVTEKVPHGPVPPHNSFGWYSTRNGWSEAQYPYCLPDAVFDALPGAGTKVVKHYPTHEAAADALAVAIATLVRTYVWGNNDDQS